MQIHPRTTKRWLVVVLTAICVAGVCVGIYIRALRRPIPALIEAAGKPHESYWPIFHTFSPTQKAHVLDGDFLVVKKVDRLPEDLKSAFCRLAGMDNFEMADPGEEYQVTDVIVEKGLPFQRLLFAGISNGKYFIHYETGGIAHSYHVAVFSVDSERKVTFVWGGPGGQGAKDLTQLRTMVAAGVYKDDQAYYWD
jgi:hypothetical protein